MNDPKIEAAVEKCRAIIAEPCTGKEACDTIRAAIIEIVEPLEKYEKQRDKDVDAILKERDELIQQRDELQRDKERLCELIMKRLSGNATIGELRELADTVLMTKTKAAMQSEKRGGK